MVRHTLKILQHLILAAFDHFCTLCTKGLKVKKMSVPKTEGESLLFHIGNDFPNMISVTSEVGFYVQFLSFGISILRSNHQRCFVKKGFLRNVTKFIGKHLCHSLFFNKVAGLRPATLLKLASGLQLY